MLLVFFLWSFCQVILLGRLAFAQFSEGKSLWEAVSLWEWPLHVALTRREELSLEEQRGFAYR